MLLAGRSDWLAMTGPALAAQFLSTESGERRVARSGDEPASSGAVLVSIPYLENGTPMEFQAELDSAIADKTLVHVVRAEFEESCPEIEGQILSSSDGIVCLAFLDDRVRFNGVDIFYRDQISEIDAPAPHAGFYQSALRLRGDPLPEAPPVDLGSMRRVLETVSEISPLIVIHREVEEPEACDIGKITSFGSETFALREINPDAEWEEGTTEFRYDEITRVSYGGEYEAALALVAGVVS